MFSLSWSPHLRSNLCHPSASRLEGQIHWLGFFFPSTPSPLSLNLKAPLRACSSKTSPSEKHCVFWGPVKHVPQPVGHCVRLSVTSSCRVRNEKGPFCSVFAWLAQSAPCVSKRQLDSSNDRPSERTQKVFREMLSTCPHVLSSFEENKAWNSVLFTGCGYRF